MAASGAGVVKKGDVTLTSLLLGKAFADQVSGSFLEPILTAMSKLLLPRALLLDGSLSKHSHIRVAVWSGLVGVVFTYLANKVAHKMWLIERKGFMASFFEFVRSLPIIRNQVKAQKLKIAHQIESSLPKSDGTIPPNDKIPEKGYACDEILQILEDLSETDVKYEDGDSSFSGTTYMTGKEHYELLNKAYGMFALTNPLHSDVFPSVGRMEREVISMTASLMGGGKHGPVPSVCGCMTSGGTESIITAVLVTKEKMCYERGIEHPELVMAQSAHPAFDKACKFLGIRLRRVKVGKDYRADPQAMAKACNRNTIMMIASAPSFPHGVVDPVEDLAKICIQKGLCLHVDCCLGGYVLPFARQLGYPIPFFGFEVEGVTSISCDTHKFAMTQKGSSVVLYRDREFRKYQFTSCTEWTGGMYISPSMPGSRSGSLIAQTWAALMHMGMDGYLAATEKLMQASKTLQEGIKSTPGLELIGSPDMCVVAWTSTSVNILQLNDLMGKRHWSLNVLQFPNSVHMCLTMGNVNCVDRLLSDLKECLRTLEHAGPSAVGSGGMAPIYGMATALPDRGSVSDILLATQDAICGQ
mmetsp:Transcript_2660/g.3011  ORF Transcript_2660/g.3011 Transcript_2660/m.3011 type:complete len:584 (+) Transcript_2660:222-1973(+)|eukprot:CAMPEP_0197845264 /NCGR_PEP_ID=MMETSP1438-20131217/2209_1 /TAXON_ID=1461541 /ORGANISM="Pterosperma sp., Strain CCMP1384" /LENGTH=583 /DNA_ID=CAMNT_0043456477 /DNA_START=211 /DNA_END=1962 /DNA_ORIENTATION=-